MVSRSWQRRKTVKRSLHEEPRPQVSHGRVPDDLQAAIKLEALEHLHTYEVVAE